MNPDNPNQQNHHKEDTPSENNNGIWFEDLVKDINQSKGTNKNSGNTKLWIIVAAVIAVICILIVVKCSNGSSASEDSNSEYTGYSEYNAENTEVEVATTDPNDEIRKELSSFAINYTKKCPKVLMKEIGMGIDSMVFSNDQLAYHVSIGKAGETLWDELNRSDKARKDYFKSSLVNDKKLREKCKQLIKIGGSLNFVLHYGNQSVETIFDSEELEELQSYSPKPKTSKYDKYVTMARNVSNQCPQVVDEGMTMVKCQFKDQATQYFYNCSSEYYNFIKDNKTEWANDVKEQLTGDPTTRIFINQIKQDKVRIQYIYQLQGSVQKLILTYNPSTNTMSW